MKLFSESERVQESRDRELAEGSNQQRIQISRGFIESRVFIEN